MSGYLILAGALFLYMTGWFVVSIFLKRNDIADIAWGLGFVLLSWTAFFVFGGYSLVAFVVNLMLTIWGLRLSAHIFGRLKGKKEDKRYVEMIKKKKGSIFLRAYLQVFLLQGLFLFLICLPVLYINSFSEIEFHPMILLGMTIWLGGFIFETVSDRQLASFIANPENKGKIMQEGLWKYSRHPNYFGEVVLWWGVYFIALSLPQGVYTAIGPLTITTLILFVSGIPLLEKRYAGRSDYAKYAKKTSIFIPLPPKEI